jgi:hypothetical protein
LLRAVFFAGWILSPFTSWNDAFINIPLAYLLAGTLAKITAFKFTYLVLVCYWFSNIIGITLMYLSGRSILRDSKKGVGDILKSLGTIVIYSLIVILINRMMKI